VALGWAAATDVGRVRSVNEDSLLADPPVFMVADGMGGHEAGDVASALAVERLGRLVDSPPTMPEEVSAAISGANAAILAAGARQGDEKAMGTTAVGLVLIAAPSAPTWLVFNIGDSRIYRYLQGDLEQLSVDHSYVQEMMDMGRMTASAARTHPQRNVVTRALGVDDEAQADLWLRTPVPGERFILCSDGLSGEVGSQEMSRILSRSGPPDEAAAALVDLAMTCGGADNITVIVVDVEEVDGVAYDDQITSPRGETTRENPTATPGHPPADDASDLPSIIRVPEEISIPPLPDDEPDGAANGDSVSGDLLIAGVPPGLRIEESEINAPGDHKLSEPDAERHGSPIVDAPVVQDVAAGAATPDDGDGEDLEHG
jgi:protein phosphatase